MAAMKHRNGPEPDRENGTRSRYRHGCRDSASFDVPAIRIVSETPRFSNVGSPGV